MSKQIRVPDDFYPMLKAFAEFLRTYKPTQGDTQEEREKEKEPKRNKEKEEKDTHTTREALKISFKETPNNDFVVPTDEEVQNYLDEIGEHRFTSEYFVAKMNAIGWMAGNTRIADWKAYIKSSWQKKEDEQQLKQQLKDERQKAKNTKSASKGVDGEEEKTEPQRVESEEPKLPRREQVEKILQEKYPLDEAQAERLDEFAALVDAQGTGASDGADGGADAGIDHLAQHYGDNMVVSWIAKAILQHAEKIGTDSGSYDGGEVVKQAESILKCAKGAYRGLLTTAIFLDVLNDNKGLTKGRLGMEIMLKMKTMQAMGRPSLAPNM